MSQPREAPRSGRYERADEEALSRLAAVKLAQEEGGESAESAGSVASPGTPAGDEATSRGAKSPPRDAAMPGVKACLTDVVGDTPTVYLSSATTEGCVADVVAKLESNNPCCSVKDRCALRVSCAQQASAT